MSQLRPPHRGPGTSSAHRVRSTAESPSRILWRDPMSPGSRVPSLSSRRLLGARDEVRMRREPTHRKPPDEGQRPSVACSLVEAAREKPSSRARVFRAAAGAVEWAGATTRESGILRCVRHGTRGTRTRISGCRGRVRRRRKRAGFSHGRSRALELLNVVRGLSRFGRAVTLPGAAFRRGLGEPLMDQLSAYLPACRTQIKPVVGDAEKQLLVLPADPPPVAACYEVIL